MRDTMTADLATLFADSQPHNSDFQVERFAIAANGGTPFGCYMQALRDLRSSYDALVGYWFEVEKLRLDLETAEIASDDDEAKPSIDQRRARLEAQRLRARIESLEHFATDQARVFARILALARGYKRMIGPLNAKKRDELERDLWEHRVKATIAAELMSGVPALSRSTLEMIGALPVDMRARVWQKSHGQTEQLALCDWWKNHSPSVPDVESVSLDEVKRIVWRSPSHPLTLV